MNYEKELLCTLFEDVEILKEIGNAERPQTAQIRSSVGPILRRWMVQGNLKPIEKALRPDVFKVEFLSDDTASKLANQRKLPSWVGNFSFGSVAVSQRAGTPADLEDKIRKGGGTKVVIRSIHEFAKQPVCRILGKTFTRKEVINFHANKLGGAHFDPGAVQRDPTNMRLREVFGLEVSEDGTKVQVRLGPSITEAKQDPLRRAGVYELADLIVLDAGLRIGRCIEASRAKLQALLR